MRFKLHISSSNKYKIQYQNIVKPDLWKINEVICDLYTLNLEPLRQSYIFHALEEYE